MRIARPDRHQEGGDRLTSSEEQPKLGQDTANACACPAAHHRIRPVSFTCKSAWRDIESPDRSRRRPQPGRDLISSARR